MKRKDAFRLLRTICQRLDEVDPKTFEVEPRRLYLFGSVLTHKPFPNNIDLILVHEHLPNIDYNKFLNDLANRRPILEQRLAINLRRGMKKIRISKAKTALENWQERSLFLVIRPRLIWEPGGNWKAVVDDIEANPLPWPGPLPADAREKHEAFIQSMSRLQYLDRLIKALAEIEGQMLQPVESSDAAGVGTFKQGQRADMPGVEQRGLFE